MSRRMRFGWGFGALRLHRPGAEARLRDAIIAMQAAGASDNDIATFRKALPQPGAR